VHLCRYADSVYISWSRQLCHASVLMRARLESQSADVPITHHMNNMLLPRNLAKVDGPVVDQSALSLAIF
jgi:hypothetical protein